LFTNINSTIIEYLPHAIFTDCTHDNETPTQKRTTADALSTGALVAMTACAIGSNRGYDELFPKHISLPSTNGQYPQATADQGIMPGIENLKIKDCKRNAQTSRLMISFVVKRLMLKLHQFLAVNHYSEIHVHRDDTVCCCFCCFRFATKQNNNNI
jgi:hypothetical protein